jgi:hypothetical protein
VLDQSHHDVVEYRRDFFGDAVVTGQKQAGDVLQYREVPFGRIAFERDFEFVNNLQSLRYFSSYFGRNSSCRLARGLGRAIDWSFGKLRRA